MCRSKEFMQLLYLDYSPHIHNEMLEGLMRTSLFSVYTKDHLL
jgi:hypothetical protein